MLQGWNNDQKPLLQKLTYKIKLYPSSLLISAFLKSHPSLLMSFLNEIFLRRKDVDHCSQLIFLLGSTGFNISVKLDRPGSYRLVLKH